ncbi:hypothetical protein JNK13_08160 [bacterium]|nr:hypothetical protein [bacterium]
MTNRITVDKILAALTGAGEKSLLEALRELNCTSPVLVSGKEPFRVTRFLDFIKAEAKQRKLEPVTFYAQDFTTQGKQRELKSQLANISLFCPESLTIIKGLEGAKAGVIDFLNSALVTLPSHSTVMLVAAGSETNKALEKLEVKSNLEISALNPENLKRWISRESERYGLKAVESEAASLLAELFQEDLAGLSLELSRIALILNPGETVTRQHVETLTHLEREQSGYFLIRSIAAQNLSAVLDQVQRLMRQGQHPLQAVYFLSQATRALIAEKEYGKAASTQAKDVAKFWVLKNLSGVSNRFSLEALTQMLSELATLDLSIKSSNLTPEFLYEQALLRSTLYPLSQQMETIRGAS